MTLTGWGRTMSVCGRMRGRLGVMTPTIRGRTTAICGRKSERFGVMTSTSWGRMISICGRMLMLGRSSDVLNSTSGFGGLVHALQEHRL